MAAFTRYKREVFFHLNPHQRHAVLPSAGNRLVIVGYTPGVLQNLSSVDRSTLWGLGFPMPLFDDDAGGGVRINMLSVQPELCQLNVQSVDYTKGIDCEVQQEHLEEQQEGPGARDHQSGVSYEEWVQWEMGVVLPSEQPGMAIIHNETSEGLCAKKAEVGYTENMWKGSWNLWKAR